MVTWLGWIGSVLLALCAAPQAVQSWDQRNSYGVNRTFLWTWALGELFVLVYMLSQSDILVPLVLNYVANLICLGVILYYSYWPGEPFR